MQRTFKEYTILPNPFNWPYDFLLEAFRDVCGASCSVVCFIPYKGGEIAHTKSVPATYLLRNGCGSLITRPCHLDLSGLDLRGSTGGWFMFEGDPAGAIQQYRTYALAAAERPPDDTDFTTTNFRLKQFEIYYDEMGDVLLHMPVLIDTYEMRIECTL
jgi:hypothetical protein